MHLWRLRNLTVCQEQTWRPENQGRYWYISYSKGQRRRNETSHYKHWVMNIEIHFSFYVLIYSGPHLMGWCLIEEVNLLCWVHQFKWQSHFKIPSQTFPDIMGIIWALSAVELTGKINPHNIIYQICELCVSSPS